MKKLYFLFLLTPFLFFGQQHGPNCTHDHTRGEILENHNSNDFQPIHAENRVSSTIPYSNSFENGADDWVIGYPSDLATAGIWEIAEPVATFNDEGNQIQPSSDNTSNGTYCFITGNGYEDGNGGFDDVDNGKTTLYSPIFDFFRSFISIIVRESRI